MFVQQGHSYFGGVQLPFWAVISLLKSGIESKGFDQVEIYDRDKFVISRLPAVPQGSSNEWNTVIIGRRSGPDDNMDLPSQLKWVVDVTPVMARAGQDGPGPPLPEPTQPDQPGQLPSWSQRDVAEAGPPVVQIPSGLGMSMAIGMGVIGGAALAYHGANHLFGVGMTAKEKRGILMFSGGIIATWAAINLLGISKDWADPEAAAKRIGEMFQ